MRTLLRKCRSLLFLLSNRGDLRRALVRNHGRLRARLNGRGWFQYRFLSGFHYICDPANQTSLRLFADGYQEKVEIELSRAWLQADDFAVDVGANVGLFSAAFGSSVGRGGAVLAIEPSASSFALLVETVRRLKLDWVVPVACCASNSESVSSFFVSASPAANSEEESMCIAAHRADEFRRVIAPCARIDQLCANLLPGKPPSLIKIDVEGAEPMALEGAGNLLSSDSPPLILIEIHRVALANFRYSPAEVLKFLEPTRFDLFFVPRSVSDVTSQRRHGAVYPLLHEYDLPIYSNVIAIPKIGRFAERKSCAVKCLL